MTGQAVAARGLLEGKVVLVIPGGYGIGHDACLRFAREGARVLVASLDEENGRKTVEAVAAQGGEARFAKADLLHDATIGGAVRAALDAWGTLDGAFCCPDAYVPGLCHEQPTKDFDYLLRWNARSCFFVAKHAYPAMAERTGGSIVFLASMYAQVTGAASCGYEVSKGIVTNMAMTFAERFAGRRVRVNAISHGHVVEGPRGLRDEIPTYLIRSAEESERLAKFYPAGRLALGDEVAAAAAFLLSDGSQHVTGTTLTMDGGFVTK